jgi:pimeloyl-ACP methyl ester carboxylesterase
MACALLPCLPASAPLQRVLEAGETLSGLEDPPSVREVREGTTRIYGEGRPLVLLHGAHALGNDDARIDALARVIANRGLKVFVPSLPGLRSLRLLDDDAVLVRRIGPEGAALVGVSLGGTLALQLASQDPAGRWSMVWTIGAAHDLTTLARSARAPGAEAYLTEVMRSIAGGTLEHGGFERALMRSARHSPAGHLADVRLPLFVLHGQSDPLVSSDHAAHICAEAPRCRLLISPVLSHSEVETASFGDRFRLGQFLAETLRVARGR